MSKEIHEVHNPLYVNILRYRWTLVAMGLSNRGFDSRPRLKGFTMKDLQWK
jgi:hypothetical protein